jgi:hydrogenase maturation protease
MNVFDRMTQHDSDQNNLPELSNSEDVLVLGLGNPLYGDDGAGIRAVQLLANMSLPRGAHIEVAGLPGWGLVSWLEGWKSVILVDAVDMSLPAGEWRRFSLAEVRLWLKQAPMSLHEPGLASGLALTEALDLLPDRLWIYGIQPANTTEIATLSPEVTAGLTEMVADIVRFLEKAVA